MRTLVAVGLTVLWSSAWQGSIAQAQASETASEAFRLAQTAERDLDFDEAERRYEEAMSLEPTSRHARRAESRLSWLLGRRDPTGGYTALSALERMRRTAATADTLGSFEREMHAMPPGRARREALFLLAESWHRRLDDPSRAIPFYQELLQSEGITAEELGIALVGLAEARAANGERARGIAELDEAGLGATFEASELRTAERRATLHSIALGLLLVALLLVFGVGRPWQAGVGGLRDLVRPAPVLAALYVLAVPAILAGWYAPATLDSFGFFAVGAAVVMSIAVLSARALTDREARVAARLAVVAGVIGSHAALFYLVLERVGSLESFGL